MSETFMPVRCSSLAMAGTGPAPMMRGGTPIVAQSTMRPSGVRPLASAALRSATTMKPAPSVTPEELPAVTLPSFLKAGFRLDSFSRVTPGRGNSSTAKLRVPFLPSGTSMAMIWRARKPDSMPLPARCWLIWPHSSIASRPYW